MTITNILERKFNVKEVKHEGKVSGNDFFTAIDIDFNDEVEIKVTHTGNVYIRMSVEGVDIDVEIDGVSDFYILQGTLEVDKLTIMLEEIESLLTA